MTKIITINSCRECDSCKKFYDRHSHQSYECLKYDLVLHRLDTIHPDCKLNDLPTVEEIQYEASFAKDNAQRAAVVHGANFVINKSNGE